MGIPLDNLAVGDPSMLTTAGSSVKQDSDDNAVPSKDAQGTLSSVSVLLDLLESASLRNVSSRGDENVAPRHRSNANAFPRVRQNAPLNGLDLSRDENTRTRDHRYYHGEWKPLDAPGRQNSGLNFKRLEPLHKSFSKGSEQHSMQPGGFFSSSGTTSETLQHSRSVPSSSAMLTHPRDVLKSPRPSSTCVDGVAQDVEGIVHPSGSTPEALVSGTKRLDQDQVSPSASLQPKAKDTWSGSGLVRPEGAWRPSQPSDPRACISREMKGLLNKLTVENFPILADQSAQLCAKVNDEEVLNELLNLVLDKAFSEPDFSELYADLCLILSYSNPMFFSPASAHQGSAKTSHQTPFSSLIIKKWGNEFNKLPAMLELTEEQKLHMSPEDQEAELMQIKARMRGLCVCFGEFLLRRIVSMRGFNLASCILLGGEQPKEYLVEGLCQMITTAGAFLDKDPMGKPLLDNVFGRLEELQSHGLFSKRISCLVQDLFDARKVKWHRKIHKERAKGLSRIKQDAENANLVGGSVVRAQYGTVVQLGQRSNVLENAEYAQYMKRKEEEFLNKQKSFSLDKP